MVSLTARVPGILEVLEGVLYGISCLPAGAASPYWRRRSTTSMQRCGNSCRKTSWYIRYGTPCWPARSARRGRLRIRRNRRDAME